MTNDFYFDDFRVEPRNYKIFRADHTVALEPKTFQILMFLLENHDRVVEKRELLDAVWKDVAVTENALTREVGKLRKALGDDPKAPKYVETVHTRGYRFIASVRTVEVGSVEDAPKETGPEIPVLLPLRPPAGIDSPTVSRWLPKQMFVLFGALALLAGGALLLSQRAAWGTTSGAKHGPTTLAVLPFRSLDGDPNDRYSGLGIADALITKLSNSSQLALSPISTILHYTDPARDSLAVGRAMNVDYVLEGKFQRMGDHMRVTVQLLCVACDGASRWAASFDETSGDLFQVQDSISQRVAAALPLNLSHDEQQRLAKRETTRPEAQLALAKGKILLDDDTGQSLENAIDAFKLATSRDSNFAMAWILLADGIRRRELYGAAPQDFIPKTREAIAKAREADDGLAYTHSMLGMVAFQYDWDFATAEREYQRALQLQPSWSQQWHARYLLATNRAAEAGGEYRRFMRMVPFSTWGTINFAQFLFLTGEYPAAVEQIQKVLERQPDYAPAHELLGLIYEQEARADKAEHEFQKASERSNGQFGSAALGHLYAVEGRRAHVQRILDNLDVQRKHRYVAPFERAVVYAGLGDQAKAVDELERAYAERSLSAQSLRFDPRLNNVRKEPRYLALAKKLQLNN
jgi:DNA-binding winged helix-turn-helix (wHTH) protein/TolB-like protein/Tfp pilus assembly protein PilF